MVGGRRATLPGVGGAQRYMSRAATGGVGWAAWGKVAAHLALKDGGTPLPQGIRSQGQRGIERMSYMTSCAAIVQRVQRPKA